MHTVLTIAYMLSGLLHQAPPTVAGGWSQAACDQAVLSEADDECSSVAGWLLHKDTFHTSTNLSVWRKGSIQAHLDMGYQTTLGPNVEWYALSKQPESWAVLVPYRWEDPEDVQSKPHNGVLVMRLAPTGVCGVGIEKTIDAARRVVATKGPKFRCPAKRCDYELGPCPSAKIGRFLQRWPSSVASPPKSQAQILNERGLAARRAGQHLRAAKAYQEALELDPLHVWARYNLACELAVLGEYDSALAQLEALARLTSQEARDALRAARKDTDFSKIRDNPRFLRVTR